MRKIVRSIISCFCFAVFCWGMLLIRDRQMLNRELIRLHVVANSDSEEDQAIKLQVRNAVLDSIQSDLQQIGNISAAKDYLIENLPKIETAANQVLKDAGVNCEAVVSLCREAFDTRYYDTFTLPAGVYEALRVTIGEGEGKNWWCVAFPSLCVPATSREFADTAVSAGFSHELTETLTEESYEVRFFLLDALGEMEIIFFKG